MRSGFWPRLHDCSSALVSAPQQPQTVDASPEHRRGAQSATLGWWCFIACGDVEVRKIGAAGMPQSLTFGDDERQHANIATA